MVDEIFNKVSKMVYGEIPNGKFQIARMYGAFEREQEKVKIHDKYRDYCNMIIQDIIDITDNSAILIVKRKTDLSDTVYYHPMILSCKQTILCETLDEAMIALVCIRNNCLDAFGWINKLMK